MYTYKHIYHYTLTHRSICVLMAFLLAVLKESLCLLRTPLPTTDAPLCTDTLVLVSLTLAPAPGSCHGTLLPSGTPPWLTTQSPWRLREVRRGHWMCHGEWMSKKKGFRWPFPLYPWTQSTLQPSLLSWQMSPVSLIVLFSTQTLVVRAITHTYVAVYRSTTNCMLSHFPPLSVRRCTNLSSECRVYRLMSLPLVVVLGQSCCHQWRHYTLWGGVDGRVQLQQQPTAGPCLWAQCHVRGWVERSRSRNGILCESASSQPKWSGPILWLSLDEFRNVWYVGQNYMIHTHLYTHCYVHLHTLTHMYCTQLHELRAL